MRRLIIPTCLFLSAWAHPAGTLFETSSEDSSVNTTVIAKTVAAVMPASAAVADVPPAETTAQALVFSGDTANDPPEDSNATAQAPDAPEPPVVRLPPRRAVPHHVVCQALASAAADYDLPTPFFIRLIWQESGFNQNAVSRAGAQGVAQFMPAVAASMRLSDPFNPVEALRSSAQLLRDLFRQFGNLGLAAAAYNAGPKRVQNWLSKQGKLPKETRDYVQRITGQAAEHWKVKKVASPMHVPARAPCQREAGLYAADGPAKIPLPPAREEIRQIAAKESGKESGKPQARGRVRLASAGNDQVTLHEGKPQAKEAVKQAATPRAKAQKQQAKHDNKPAQKPVQLAARRATGAKAKPANGNGKRRPAQLAMTGETARK